MYQGKWPVSKISGMVNCNGLSFINDQKILLKQIPHYAYIVQLDFFIVYIKDLITDMDASALGLSNIPGQEVSRILIGMGKKVLVYTTLQSTPHPLFVYIVNDEQGGTARLPLKVDVVLNSNFQYVN